MYVLLVLVFAVYNVQGLSRPDSAGSFIFELPDNERFCFYQEVKQDAEYEMDYQVVKGGNNDVDVKIYSPDKKILYEKFKSTYDNIKLTMQTGTYEFCFSNEFSTITHKQVSINLFPTSPLSLKEEAGEDLKPSVETMIESLLEDIHAHNTNVESLQKTQLNRGTLSFNIAHDLNVKIQHWSLGVVCIIALTSLGQVFCLKNLFKTKLETMKPNMGMTQF